MHSSPSALVTGAPPREIQIHESAMDDSNIHNEARLKVSRSPFVCLSCRFPCIKAQAHSPPPLAKA